MISYGPVTEATFKKRAEESELEAQVRQVRQEIAELDADRAIQQLQPAKNPALEKKLDAILEQLERTRSARQALEPRARSEVEAYLDAIRQKTYDDLCEHRSKLPAVKERINNALSELAAAQEAGKAHNLLDATLDMKHTQAAKNSLKFKAETMILNGSSNGASASKK